ncbi:hypothetical protein BC829DRAFT_13750 [Chytridium lagenaria]|nr:hypothetical protein BC829DRAFT_13750 [Chytridium lagenaria]
MRLFTRSFAEVNKSLGLPEEEVKIRRTERRAVGDVSKAVGVYIYGLPKWVRVPEILAVFSDFGAIVNVAIVSKPRKDDQRAYAYVDYEGPGSAAKAMEALKDKTFFQMKEPLEMRPHFDDSRGLESAPRSVESELKVEKKPAMQKKLSSNDVGKEAKDGKAGDKLESQAFDYNTLHLANLPSTVDKSEVEKLFAGFGNIRRIHIVQRPKDNKAFAFVSFRQTNAAREALKAVKDTRPFSMTENLKVEYSRADSRERSRTKVDEKPSVAAAPKPRSKTLERVERPPKHMRNTRTVVFVREVDEKNKESVKDKLAAVGALKTFHVVPRVDGSGFSAVVCFEKGEDATKAVKDKVENAVFPRQRRLTVTNLPKDVTEGDLKTWLAGTGEIRRVDVDGTTAEVEFSKGDSAVVAFHLMLETMIKGVRVSVGYSPSKKNEEEDEDEKEEKEVAVAAEEVKVEEVHVEVEEVAEVHHAGGDDYFGASSSEDEGDVEVVNLEDLGSGAVGVEVEEVVSLEELGGVAEEEVVSLEDLAEMPVESAAVTVEAVSSVEVVAEKPEVAVEKPAEDVVPAVSA